MNERMYPPRRSSRQQSSSGIPGLNHSRQSWSSPDGSHFTVETASYTSPGLSFGSAGAGLFDSFETFPTPSRSRTTPVGGNSLLGNALGLLDNVVFGQGQREERLRRPQGTRQRTVVIDDSEGSSSEEEEVESDDDLAYGSLNQRSQGSRSVLSRLKGRILDNGKNRTTRSARDPEIPSPVPGNRLDETSRARPQARRFQTETRQPSVASVDEMSSDESEFDSPEDDTPRPISLAALERAVERERQSYARTKRRFQDASQRTPIDYTYLQKRLDDMKAQERALELAERDFRRARSQQQNPRPSQQRSRPSTSRQQSATTVNLEDQFMPQQSRVRFASRHPDPISGAFESFETAAFGNFDPLAQHRAFDRMFTQLDPNFGLHGNLNGFSFFAGPANTSRRHSYHPNNRPGAGTSYQTRQSAARNAMPEQIPVVRHQPAGSAKLFETYNSRWLSLPVDSPTIPYPTRTLTESTLSEPVTIPHLAAHTWSTEQIMQANAQLFFLQALGLTPKFSDEGVIVISWATVGDENRKALVEILKKERVRWHSDRLGRRNGGQTDGGPNEALQKNERARAVFHGVCALAELAVPKARQG